MTSSSPYRASTAARGLTIDLDSPLPLYRQIADGIRALIARGHLGEGDALPSVRKLGAMLGVNLNTVAKAYRLLAEEDAVALKQGAPARVRAPPIPRDRALDDRSRRRLFDWVGRARLSGASEVRVREVFEEAVRRFYREGEGEER